MADQSELSEADKVVLFILNLILCTGIIVGGIWLLLSLPVPTLLVIIIVILVLGGCSA